MYRTEETHLIDSTQEDDAIVAQYQQSAGWGLSASVDLYDCNLSFMKDETKIRHFAKELVQFLDMKAFGDTLVVHFGEEERVAGFSMFQLIETSGIAGHFANASKAIYLDIFSCKIFRPHAAGLFCKQFFEADRVRVHYVIRE